LAVLVALVSNDPVGATIVLAVVVVVSQLEGNLLQPVLMGKAMAVHGLVILLALTVGTILAGIIGAVLSVPLTAVAWAIIPA
jgi:predicted PurR-regulated permease PerM